VPQKSLAGNSHKKTTLPIFKRNQSDLRYLFDTVTIYDWRTMSNTVGTVRAPQFARFLSI